MTCDHVDYVPPPTPCAQCAVAALLDAWEARDGVLADPALHARVHRMFEHWADVLRRGRGDPDPDTPPATVIQLHRQETPA